MSNIFSNGFRYRAASPGQPAFMAVYDVTAMEHLETEAYASLRARRSLREAATIGQVQVKRYLYDLLLTKQSASFTPIEHLTDRQADGIVTVAVEITPTASQGDGDHCQTWFTQEHSESLAEVPGWLRSRLLKTSTLEGTGKEVVYLCLHDYAKENGLRGPEHQASMDAPWRKKEPYHCVASKGRQVWSLFYVFGPAPRDLSSLSELPASARFASADGKTRTEAGSEAVISSCVTTQDSLAIPYRLEGNPCPRAPVVAFSNSLLTSLHMWDAFVSILKRNRPELGILRYDTRGRHAIPQPPEAATLETLTDDLRHVLDAVRITKLHALVGVSLGGATALSFAMKYPARLDKFIACDFNTTSSPANTQAWKDRIAMAERDSGEGMGKLAGQTVARWFHPASADKKELAEEMAKMVAANSVEGFRNSCTALWDYDLKPKMKECSVPGMFVVGQGDAIGVVEAMEGFRGLLGDKGAVLKVVRDTGHLPMFEDAEAFWAAVKEYL